MQAACALRNDSTAVCWGLLNAGAGGDQSGNANWNGHAVGSLAPWKLTPFTDVRRVSSLMSTSCVVRSDGTVWCVGGNTLGQLGNNTVGNPGSAVPSQVQLLSVPAGGSVPVTYLTGMTEFAAQG